MSDLPPSVAIAIATVVTPLSANDEADGYRHFIGVALFEVEEHAPGEFLYRLQVRTIPAGTSEAVLVEWLTPRLPTGRVAIGWHLASNIVPALLEASEAAAPAAARRFVDALAATVAIDAVDLADALGGTAAPALGDVCAAADIPAWSMSDAEILGAWGVGRRIDLVGMLATNVLAIWRLWAKARRPTDDTPQRFAVDVLSQWRIDGDDVTGAWRSGGRR